MVSETAIDEKNGSIIYKYIPASGFTGIDEVLLSHNTESSVNTNSSCNNGGDNRGLLSSSISVSSIAVKITEAD